ncbi:MAG: hypothetical protein AB7G08_32435 [Hyphomicrobiaceae bacterium]
MKKRKGSRRGRTGAMLDAIPVPDAFGAGLAARALTFMNVASVCTVDEAAEQTLETISKLHVVRALHAQRSVAALVVVIDESDCRRLSFTGSERR